MDNVCSQCGKPVLRFAGSVRKGSVCDECLAKEQEKYTNENLKKELDVLSAKVTVMINQLNDMCNNVEKCIAEINKIKSEIRKKKAV